MTNDEMTPTEIAAKVIAEYERIVRANNSPTFPTIENVANCDDGIFGAFGEVCDLAGQMGYVLDTDDLTNALDEALLDLQAKFTAELES